MKIAVGLIVVCLVVFSVSLFQSANPFDHTQQRIIIPKGASTATVQRILEEEGILKTYSSFSFSARVLWLATSIQAGEYLFSPSESLWQILLKLKKGEVLQAEQVRVTFPEGTSIYKMGEILKKRNVAIAESFQSLVDRGISEELREKHWGIFKYIPSESLEGYLYPDTYHFVAGVSRDQLVEIMLQRFEEMVVPFWVNAKNDTKMSLHEVLTLASIIEKEAQKPKERPIISSVFHNRLKVWMPLAADPTIKYALERPTKKVYHDQLEIDSLYNTYKRYGLPPGPICNPGIDSIKAAIYPAKTNYFFFVANKDGSHIFTRNWQEHQKARSKVSTPTQ
ncbi:MAG: endolytic transglycosylase MltG [bacterium]